MNDFKSTQRDKVDVDSKKFKTEKYSTDDEAFNREAFKSTPKMLANQSVFQHPTCLQFNQFGRELIN